MPNFLVVVLFLAGVVLLAWFAWVSLQSLIQARLLLRLGTLAAHLPERPGPAAVRGPVTITGRMEVPGRDDCVWYQQTVQVYRRRGKNSGWKTSTDNQYVAAFRVEASGRVFHVEDFPSECHGIESTTEYLDAAWLGLFHSNGHRRIVHRWLRIPSRLTVLGRLEQKQDESRLLKDNKVGLLFSPHSPGRAAAIEIAKGLAGLLGVTGIVALGLFLYYQQKR